MGSQPLYSEDWSSPEALRVGCPVILSVDNDSGVLYRRYQLLSAAGYAVLSATDGAQALDIFGNYPVALVVLDYALEAVDGGIIAEAMKFHAPDIPIVMISGTEPPEQYPAVVNDHVRKGEGLETLLESVRRLLPLPGRPQVSAREPAPSSGPSPD